MKKTAVVAVLLAAMSLGAQTKLAQPQQNANGSIQYTPLTCARGGELPLMQLNVEGKGELRAYFRRLNTTDWCSVEGVNEGPLSRVVLPKFDPGDEIEYFFTLIDGRRVVARSQRIYRLKVTNECEAAWARHVTRFALSCGDDPGGIPSSIGAGFAVNDEFIDGEPPFSSPDRPVDRDGRTIEPPPPPQQP
ncbi:MAG: hypothetical protein ACTHQM_22590 [Thermoanaerobaculia bacterium]